MTYAPAPIKALAAYWVGQGGVNLGIVGDVAHQAKGVSYHLGADQLSATAYSIKTSRDKAGLTNAASAIDLGRLDGSLEELRRFSSWFVGRCRSNAEGTSDVREVIYAAMSRGVLIVLRWDRERGYDSLPQSGEADDSHKTHTHISFYRDSETRSKVGLFSPYFEEEEDMDPKVDIPVGRVNVAAGGTVYANPEKSAVLIQSWAGAQNVQAYSQRPGLTAIRIDLIGAGGDDLRIGWIGSDKVTPVTADTSAARLAGRREEWDRQEANATVTLAPRP